MNTIPSEVFTNISEFSGIHQACKLSSTSKEIHDKIDLELVKFNEPELIFKAIKKNNIRLAVNLIGNRNLNFNTIRNESYPHNYPIHETIIHNNIEILKLLLESGSDVNLKNELGATPLHMAINVNNLEIVKILIKRDADLNSQDSILNTPFQIALSCYIIKDHEDRHILNEIIKLLIVRGADINEISHDITSAIFHHGIGTDNLFDSDTPFIARGVSISLIHETAYYGDLQMTYWAIQNGANILAKDIKDTSILHYLSLSKCETISDICRMAAEFIRNGVNPNDQDYKGNTAIHLLCKNDYSEFDIEFVKTLIRYDANVDIPNNRGHTPLRTALKHKKYKLAEYLVDACGADINIICDGINLLHWICNDMEHGTMLEPIMFLLNRGISVNSRTNNSKMTPLHIMACHAEREKIIKLLIFRGAEVNALDDYGFTPLHYAAEYGMEQNIEILIKHGANTKTASYKGYTPLHLAAMFPDHHIISKINTKKPLKYMYDSKPLCIEILLQNGAIIDARDCDGNTPLHWTATHDINRIADVLIKHGSKINSRNNDGNTVTHLSCILENDCSLLDLLRKHKPNLNSQNDEGFVPAYYSNTGISRKILGITK